MAHKQQNELDDTLDASFPSTDASNRDPGRAAAVVAERPAQTQDQQPGNEHAMTPRPESFMKNYKPAGKLAGKVALISGGDSGIGRAVAIGYAKEGADVAFIYLCEDKDAQETVEHIEAEGRKALAIKGDICSKQFCEEAVEETVEKLGGLNILVNNAAEQHVQENIEDISEEQLRRTFDTNFFGLFFLTQCAMKHLKMNDSIVNTASIVAYRGKDVLMDYASTKGAIVGLTRSLASNLAERKIRVNAVAPGPIWTPLIPASFDAETVKEFGEYTQMGRAGQPDEVAPSYIFLASEDASYMTGQVLHPNGGTIIGG